MFSWASALYWPWLLFSGAGGMPAASGKSGSRFLHRKHLFQTNLPLTQTDADHRKITFVINANDTADLVEARHMDRIVGLQIGAGLAQGCCLFGLALKYRGLLLKLLALHLRFVLGTEGLGTGLFRVLALLLQQGDFRGPALAAAQIMPGPFQQTGRQFQTPGNFQSIAHAELADQ